MKDAAILISLQKFIDACRSAHLKMAICFVDRSGHMHMLWRETGAWLGSLDLARRKAWTSVAFSGPTPVEGRPTEEIMCMTQPGCALQGLDQSNDANISIVGGGIPIYINNKLHGAVGVSGSNVVNDIALANIAVQAYVDAFNAADVKVLAAPSIPYDEE